MWGTSCNSLEACYAYQNDIKNKLEWRLGMETGTAAIVTPTIWEAHVVRKCISDSFIEL